MTLVFDKVDYIQLVQDYISIHQEQTTCVKKIEDEKNSDYFIDLYNQKNRLSIVMLDYTLNTMPISTTKNCWWCREIFNNSPIGIPIKYYPNTNKTREIFKKNNLNSSEFDYFETEGIFCSFPCAKSFVVSERFNTKYKNSTQLLVLLYKKIHNKITNIPTAPSWKLLKKYGGEMSISEFRDSFGKNMFIDTFNIKRPLLFSTGSLFHQKEIN